MYHMTHTANDTDPAEFESRNPVNCETCGAEHDQDEDLGNTIESVEGLDGYYCIGKCLDDARRVEYRKRAAEVVNDGCQKILSELEGLDKDFKQKDFDAVDHPTSILYDLQSRMEKFGEGKDSGWRNELMMNMDEFYYLRFKLQTVLDLMSISVRVALDMTPKQVYASEYAMEREASSLTRIATQIANLEALRDRTQNGVAA